MKKIVALVKEDWDIVSYLFFGVCTPIVNWIVYYLAMLLFKGTGMNDEMNIVISNVIAWVFAVAFAFITNKLWVFNSKSFDRKTLWHELWTFVSARLLTLLMETGILYVAALIFGTENNIINMIWKIITSILVVVLNYIFSKLFIFRKKEEAEATYDELSSKK